MMDDCTHCGCASSTGRLLQGLCNRCYLYSRRTGHPPPPHSLNRLPRVHVRFSMLHPMATQLETAARAEDISLSEWVRRACMEKLGLPRLEGYQRTDGKGTLHMTRFQPLRMKRRAP